MFTWLLCERSVLSLCQPGTSTTKFGISLSYNHILRLYKNDLQLWWQAVKLDTRAAKPMTLSIPCNFNSLIEKKSPGGIL